MTDIWKQAGVETSADMIMPLPLTQEGTRRAAARQSENYGAAYRSWHYHVQLHSLFQCLSRRRQC